MCTSTNQQKTVIPDMLSVKEAQEFIQTSLINIAKNVEQIPLTEALDRVLAENICAGISVPGFDSAAMDGYAFHIDSDTSSELTLKVVGHAYAGHPYTGHLSVNECIQIMTGAVVPEQCNTLIQQENIQPINNEYIRISGQEISAGINIRKKGENILKGKCILRAGTKLKPQDLGLLSSIGQTDVTVFKKITVAVFSTGDELCALGSPLEVGKIYDSNRIILLNMLKQMGCQTIDMGIIEDNPEILERSLKETAPIADMILTSGGVSVGEADYTKQVMAKLGAIHFWAIKMRPGRPLAFGSIQTGERCTLLFGLPGNPVAAMISFLFFVRNTLETLMGITPAPLRFFKAISTADIPKKKGRTEFQRGILCMQENKLSVSLTGNQGSGIIQSMSDADCIIQLNENQGNVKKGETVDVILLKMLR